MNHKISVRTLTISAMLTALAIIIPQFSLSLRFEPFYSYTLASHVPLFLAMFISPSVAVLVAIGTTVGFFFSVGNLMIVARAFSHLIFAIIGSNILKKKPTLVNNFKSRLQFNVFIAIIHSVCEFLIVLPFVLTGQSAQPDSFFQMILLLGVGGIIHSMVDFEIAYTVAKVTLLKKES